MALTDNLVAHWKLNEASGTRNDSHGTNHLTDNNTVTSATGKIGDAASFNAANSEWLSIAENANLDTSTDTAWTIALWVKCSAVSSACALLIKSNSIATNRRIVYGITLTSAGVPTAWAGNNTSSGTAAWGSEIDDGNWHFIVAWHDPVNDVVGIQVDGGTPVTGAWTGGTYNNAYTVTLGATDGGTLNHFTGDLDSVSLWIGKVLDSTERATLYNSGSGLDYEDFDGAGGAIAGSTTIDIAVTGAMQARGALAASADATISCTGTLTAKGSLSSAAQIDIAASGALAGKGALAGATTITILADGALTGLGGGAMAGAATISIDCSGSLTAKGSLAGSTAIDIAPAGTLQGRGSLAATAALAISCDGALTADGALAGSTTIDVAPAGVLTARGALLATATITFTLSATASGTEPAAVNIWTAARREKQWRAERRETEWEALPS